MLKFTFDIESSKSIPFLDTLITRTTLNINTKVFVKTICTNECLNYDSIYPDQYKIGAIENFLHRAYNICSTWNTFDAEVSRIRKVLVNNNFPNNIIEKTIQTFLRNKRLTNQDKKDNHSNLYKKEKEKKNNQNNVNLITQPTNRKPTAHNDSLIITLPNPTLPMQVQKLHDTARDNLTTPRTNTSDLVAIETPDALL